jgi:hypothetical protein
MVYFLFWIIRIFLSKKERNKFFKVVNIFHDANYNYLFAFSSNAGNRNCGCVHFSVDFERTRPGLGAACRRLDFTG